MGNEKGKWEMGRERKRELNFIFYFCHFDNLQLRVSWLICFEPQSCHVAEIKWQLQLQPAACTCACACACVAPSRGTRECIEIFHNIAYGIRRCAILMLTKDFALNEYKGMWRRQEAGGRRQREIQEEHNCAGRNWQKFY